ncbi:hypothetical protein UC34_01105 [Pandoraea vervacti]|uniref:Uncharacterized protein n=1 Tax=Pandoraea vervacti TaxID=656178 RepID=A0ABN4FLV3_9BURK|nr:hypothetical protein [Pandoraea vervacti]AJP55967.1 hypothetical protein UC34_01105 [Pandoraea vervacti]
MSTSISLNSVALNSRAKLDALDAVGQPKEGAAITNGRIGVNSKDQLVIFKGKTFLLHLGQCRRADKLIRKSDLTTRPATSLFSKLKFKDLRLGKPSVTALVKKMKDANAQSAMTGAPAISISKTSPFKSIITEAVAKWRLRSDPPSARVRITTQPPMSLSEVRVEKPAANDVDSAAEPKPRTAPPKPLRSFTSPLSPKLPAGSQSPAAISSHSFEFLPGTPPQSPTSPTPASASGTPLTHTPPASGEHTHSAFLDDRARNGFVNAVLLNNVLNSRER